MRMLAGLVFAVLVTVPLHAEEAPETSVDALALPVALAPETSGGPRGARSAVEDELSWLSVHQRADGSWGAADFDGWRHGVPIRRPQALPGAGAADQDALVTSLALCSGLGAGYTNRGKHPYARVVAGGLRWLKRHQDEAGHFVRPGGTLDLRTHAIATLAMTEALGMTGSPIYRTAAQRGLGRLLAMQSEDGAWRTGGHTDLLGTTWAVMALRSMQLIDGDRGARGKPPLLGHDVAPAFERVRRWLDARTDPKTGVVTVAQEPHPLLPTAVGTLLRIFLGEDPRTSPRLRAAARHLAEHPPTWDEGKATSDLAYIYFGTLVVFQVGREPWKRWNESLKRALVDTQQKDGRYEDLKGSWDPRGAWCERLGRVGATALASMCLQVYYRYDRVFGVHGGAARRNGTLGLRPARGTWRRSDLPPHAMRFLGDDGDPLPVPAARVSAELHGVRARVVLDFWIRNPRKSQQQGRLQLRLPDGAAPYYLAFGTCAWEKPAAFSALAAVRTDLASLRSRQQGEWGAMREARMARTAPAKRAYQEIVAKRRDPALLTWAGAGVFDLGVFPLFPEKLHRVVLAYEVDLMPVGGDLELRLDVPHGAEHVEVALWAGDVPVKTLPQARKSKDVHSWDDPASGEIRVLVPDPGDAALVGKDAAGDEYYAAWVRPSCDATPAASASKRALFLVDTSAGTASSRLAMRKDLLEALLDANRTELEAFALATFDTELRWWREGFVENSSENATAAVMHVTTQEPRGATDLEHALREAGQLEGDFEVFLLSDGVPSWGARDADRILAAHDPARRIFAYRTQARGRTSALLEALTAGTNGALVPVLGARDIQAAARAHRHGVWRITHLEIPGVEDLFSAGDVRTLHEGQRLLLVGRGRPEPDAGLVLGLTRSDRAQTRRLELPPANSSDMAPRAYGQAAVEAIESLEVALPESAWAYAAHFRVVRSSAALLMLESEEDYQRFGIEAPDTRAEMRAQPVVAMLPDRAGPARAESPHAWPGVILPERLVQALERVDAARFEIPSTSAGSSPVDLARDGIAGRLESSVDDVDALLAAAFVAWHEGRPDLAYRSLSAAGTAGGFSRMQAWVLARLADDLGRPELALLWYEVALGRAGGDADRIDIVAQDYRRFLRHVLAGRKPIAVKEFARARAKGLDDLHLLAEADRVVLLASAGTALDVELAVRGEQGTLYYRGHPPADKSLFFVTAGSSRGGARMLVGMGGEPEVGDLRVVGPRAQPGASRYPVQVLVTVIDDWGRGTERTTLHHVAVEDREDVVPIDPR